MSSSVEQIKERLNIADVISSYITLEKTGRNLRARCPFHNERTPSFFVSPERNSYHCFGCDKGGDIFEFVQAFEGVDFYGALQLLADKAGVPLPRGGETRRGEKDDLYRAMEEAVLFYERTLRESPRAREYLKKRGISDESIRDFRIGFAEAEWRALLSFLLTRGLQEKTLLKAGLIVESHGGRRYDRFRGRIMFPIADSSGRAIAFSGRILVGDEKEAKYINSPETALYSKSSALFGFDKAKRAMRDEGICIVVEGQMDVVIAHQSGLRNTVAASGTALSKDHLDRILRFAEKIVFAFDPDSAGLAAAERAMKLALSFGMEARLAHMPKGEDPAALGQRSPEELCARVKNAKHAVDFFLAAVAEMGYDARQFKIEAAKKVLPYIANVKNRIEQAHFVEETARRIGVLEEALWEELRMVSSAVPQIQKNAPGAEEQGEDSRQEKIKKHLAGILMWQERKKETAIGAILESTKKEFKVSLGISFEEYIQSLSLKEKERMLFTAEKAYEGKNSWKNNMEELLRNLKENVIRGRLRTATAALARAEKLRDEKRALEITGEIAVLMKSLNNPNNTN